jgi:hypothetical protein
MPHNTGPSYLLAAAAGRSQLGGRLTAAADHSHSHAATCGSLATADGMDGLALASR